MTTSIDEQITLRIAGLEDIPELSAMAGMIFQETYTGMMPEEDLQAYIGKAFSVDKIRSEWTLPTSTFIIAFCGPAWAGYAKISSQRRVERPEPGKYIEIERLYIQKKFHGKRIGAELMDACIRYAGDNGIQTIWLNVWERNTHAIEFYRRMNFEMADWSIFMRGDDAQKALWMKKNLLLILHYCSLTAKYHHMPLAFNFDRQTTFYRNPISAGDLNSPVLVESREAIRLDNAGMTFQNWCLDGFRLAHSVLEQGKETAFNIKNDIDAVKIYFNRSGHTQINYRQLSKTFSMGSGQCNMLYSSELDSRMYHIDKHSEIFSLQITRECFLELVGQGDGVLDEFAAKAARRQPALFADRWLSMSTAMDRCIGEILNCPYGGNLKKVWLRSKALELFVLFAHSGPGGSGAKADSRARHARAINPSEIERLHFVRDYLVQNYAYPNSLQALAKISGLNEFKLKKGFRELFHNSVMDFLINYRLERARELLLNSGKNISEVAYSSGYASPAYFGKAFKRKYGYSPKDYGTVLF